MTRRGGGVDSSSKGKAGDEPNGTLVAFCPDPEIFGDALFADEHVR